MQKYVPFVRHKYLSFNVIKYFQLESLIKLNKNDKKISYFNVIFLHKIIDTIAFNMLIRIKW